jgi:hypothetical protein
MACKKMAMDWRRENEPAVLTAPLQTQCQSTIGRSANSHRGSAQLSKLRGAAHVADRDYSGRQQYGVRVDFAHHSQIRAESLTAKRPTQQIPACETKMAGRMLIRLNRRQFNLQLQRSSRGPKLSLAPDLHRKGEPKLDLWHPSPASSLHGNYSVV